MTDHDPKIPLNSAIRIAGNQSKLAAALGLSKTSVSDWKKERREYLPPLHAFRFEKIFDVVAEHLEAPVR